MLSRLKEINRHLTFIDADSDEFRPYGTFAGRGPWRDLVDRSNTLVSPVEEPAYIPSIPELEDIGLPPIAADCMGHVDLQIGICRGFNTALNGMEWHDCHEIVVAANPQVMFLGLQDDIEGGEWNTRHARVCFLNGGDAVVLKPGTMHLAPCRPSHQSFLSLIILPRGVNDELTDDVAGDFPPWKHRKWILAHPDSPQAGKGAPLGVTGPNLVLNTL